MRVLHVVIKKELQIELRKMALDHELSLAKMVEKLIEYAKKRPPAN